MTLRDCLEAVLATENYYRFIERGQAWESEDFLATTPAERLVSPARLEWYPAPAPQTEMLVGVITLLAPHPDDQPDVIHVCLVA